jgi:hypothetical protein
MGGLWHAVRTPANEFLSSAPTVPGPFLTDVDSRAAVKGSRDPLGCQPAWTRFGRHVVGNLTTVSVSVHDFTITLVGFAILAGLRDRLGPERDLAGFLKWEQLCGYARASINEDWSFRGTETVRARLSGGGTIRLSERGEDQILSSQKTYGLWGLYIGPSRASGLLEGDPLRLTQAAERFIESEAMPLLGTAELARIRGLLSEDRPTLDLRKADRGILERVAMLLDRRFLRRAAEFYERHLVLGADPDRTSGRQRQLATALRDLPDGESVDWFDATREIIRRCRRESWDDLGARLERIRSVESVLAPTSRLFAHVLSRDGSTVGEIADEIGTAWKRSHGRVDVEGLADVVAELEEALPGSGRRWCDIGKAIAAGDYGEAIGLAIAQNAAVMAGRGGAAWVDAGADGIRVRYDDRPEPLPDSERIRRLWVFPYFIPSVWIVSRALAGGRRG